MRPEPLSASVGGALPAGEFERMQLDVMLTVSVKLKMLPTDREDWTDDQIRAVAREVSVYLTHVYEMRPRDLR